MKERILQYLRDFGSITTWDAINKFGCTRLHHYIYLLKKDGYTFEEERIKTTNRFGDKTSFKKYILVED